MVQCNIRNNNLLFESNSYLLFESLQESDFLKKALSLPWTLSTSQQPQQQMQGQHFSVAEPELMHLVSKAQLFSTKDEDVLILFTFQTHISLGLGLGLGRSGYVLVVLAGLSIVKLQILTPKVVVLSETLETPVQSQVEDKTPAVGPTPPPPLPPPSSRN